MYYGEREKFWYQLKMEFCRHSVVVNRLDDDGDVGDPRQQDAEFGGETLKAIETHCFTFFCLNEK